MRRDEFDFETLGVCQICGIMLRPAGVGVLVREQSAPAVGLGFQGEGVDFCLGSRMEGKVV